MIFDDYFRFDKRFENGCEVVCIVNGDALALPDVIDAARDFCQDAPVGSIHFDKSTSIYECGRYVTEIDKFVIAFTDDYKGQRFWIVKK